jgi:cardiolipin synthase A/B
MKAIVIMLLLFIIKMAIILVMEIRRPQRALAWLFILFVIPPLGIFFYYFLGCDYWQSRSVKKRGGAATLREIRKHIESRCMMVGTVEDSCNPKLTNNKDLLHLFAGLADSPLTGRNRSRVLSSGKEAFDSMLRAMENAEEHIHIEFYIFRDDKIANRFMEVMLRKVRQGVKVRLLCDGFGSHKLGRKFIHTLKKGGVEFHFFLPPLMSLLSRRLNYRNHRKIVVVDGKIGFTGGMNIGDDYLGEYPEIGYWRDTHIQLEGDSVYFLQLLFLKDWRLASGEQLSHPRLFPLHSIQDRQAVNVVESGPDREEDSIQEVYFASICAAKHRVWISSPYFIPDPATYHALKSAVLRGVDVRIIIPGEPDSWLVHYATLSYVEDLQKAGVKFYRYQKGFMHAKVTVIDELLCSVGSANLDQRSFYYNFELTVVLLDPESISELAGEFEYDMANSEFVDPEEYSKRSVMRKLKENACYLLSPLL